MAARASAKRPASAAVRGRGEPTPSLALLDPAAARWIGAFIRMTAPHPAMTQILETIERLQDRPYRTNVVLGGEPGTGKEGLARALHQLWAPGGPVVRLDVGGFPEDDALRILCGAGKTAGAAEQADRGTLIIEEIAGLGARLQVALLRLLKAGRCERIGGGGPAHRLSVAAIALTDHDLRAEVAAGRLRHDLFYRLARIELHLPPLRERADDIGPSAIWMGNRILRGVGLDLEMRPTADLQRAGAGERAACIELEAGAVEALKWHDWPGNFRELEAVLERALLLHRTGPRIGAAEVKAALGGAIKAGT